MRVKEYCMIQVFVVNDFYVQILPMFIQHSSTSILLIPYNDYSIYKTFVSRVINLSIIYLWQCKSFIIF